MAEGDQELTRVAQSATGFMANRRDVLKTATGLAAAAVVGGALLDRNQVAVAAGPNSQITGQIEGLGEFEVLAFSWGASNSGSTHVGGGAGAGKVNVQDLSFTKYTDSLTPQLFVATANGKHFPKAAIVYASKSGTPILRVEMEEVLVTSLSMGGSGGEAALTENVTLNFAKVRITYGDSSGGWDIGENKAS